MDVNRFAAGPVGTLVPIRGMDGRTGQSYDHVAFVPQPLGSEPELAAGTWRAVSRAGYALGRLQQASRQVPSPGLLRRPTLRREAQSTSALEGTFAPLEDVLAADVIEASSRSAELDEVLNYINAAEAAFKWLADQRRLTVSMISELQGILVRGTPADTADAGRVRQIQVAIGNLGGRFEDARFVPMPPGQELDVALRDLVDWMNASPSAPRDPVVSAAQTHYQFETLHPFNEGNGRIGRLLIVSQLLLDRVLDEPLLTVSPWFEARRREYQDRLAAVSAEGDWDGWVSFFAQGLEESAIDTTARVDELLEVQESYLVRLQEASAIGIVRDVASSLIEYPFLTIGAVKKRTGRTYQAASKAVARLVELGILRERTGRSYGRVYEAMDVVKVLTRP